MSPPRFDRRFQLWEYLPEHSQLLVRSPGDLRLPQDSTGRRNVDLVFRDVAYVDLPTWMPALELVAATAVDVERIAHELGASVEAERVFVIAVGDRRHAVVAGSMRIVENDLELMQSSLEPA